MTETQLIFAGPACALLALVFVSIPTVRPKGFTLGIVLLGASMLFPMVIGYASHDLVLGTLAFFWKPIAAILSAALFVGYVIKWSDKRQPLIRFLPLVLLLCGSAVDVYAVYKIAPHWGGADC